MLKVTALIKSILKRKVVKNAGWIMTGRIVQMICAFFVSILTARFLGPSNHGLINYGTAYTTFFYSICTLGLNSVLVKALIDDPDKEGEALGTSIIMQFISSILSSLVIIGIVSVVDKDEPLTITVTALCTVGMLFRVFEVLRCWFQAHLLSKYSAITSTIAYVLTSLYRVVLLIRGANVMWFAMATALDYFVIAVFLLVFYIKQNGSKLCFSYIKAKKLLKMSAPFILSGLMVAIYGTTDRLMLKHMLNESSVGYYSTAVSLCNVWVFVLSAIIDSMYPVIMKTRITDIKRYEQYNRMLYSIVFYVSICVSVLFVLFGKTAIRILYGESYLPAAAPLRVITWYVAFSYLGVARNAWIVGENLQRYNTPIYVGAALTNIVLNLLLIPLWQESGAAAASLITQISTIFVFPLFIKPMRKNTKMMVDALFLKGIR